jgi:hypothetical protein
MEDQHIGLNEPEERRLSQVRDALLALHKTIVDFERSRYENALGTIRSANHFLQLLTSDPWFAWLHPLSQLIVSIDVVLEQREEPLTTAVVERLLTRSTELLVATETGQDFSRHYFDALQDEPDVVLAHAAVIKAIGRRK